MIGPLLPTLAGALTGRAALKAFAVLALPGRGTPSPAHSLTERR